MAKSWEVAVGRRICLRLCQIIAYEEFVHIRTFIGSQLRKNLKYIDLEVWTIFSVLGVQL